MKPIDMGKMISDMGHFQIRHATLDYFKIDMDNAYIETGDIVIS